MARTTRRNFCRSWAVSDLTCLRTAQFPLPAIEQTVAAYADGRVRLLHANKSDAEKDRLRREVEHLGLLRDGTSAATHLPDCIEIA